MLGQIFATIVFLVIFLTVLDILLLLTVASTLRYDAPAWVKLMPGAVLYAVLLRRDLL